jgi:hypothetical protein
LPAFTIIMTLRGPLQRLHELLERVRADDLLALRAAVHEVVDLRGGAVVARDREAAALHVQDQVLAHHGEPDEADVCLAHL